MLQTVPHSPLPASSHPYSQVWHQKPTVDISLLLKPKDEEEPQQTASPRSVARSDSVPASVAPLVSSSAFAGGGRPLTRGLSTIPAKRPARQNDPPTSESPAKKQSKWSPEEDAKIIQLRGEGMKWEDISKHLPGRSAISCRLHYQNYLERRSEWDEDRKNKLARLYERFKADMWAKIAEEMAIPWRAAEAMHWQMGEQEMARRAGVTPFTLNNSASTPSTSIADVRPGLRTTISSSNSINRESGPLPLGPQLPSLAELTAGLPAYASPSPAHSYGERSTTSSHQHHLSRPHQTLTPPPANPYQPEYFPRRP